VQVRSYSYCVSIVYTNIILDLTVRKRSGRNETCEVHNASSRIVYYLQCLHLSGIKPRLKILYPKTAPHNDNQYSGTHSIRYVVVLASLPQDGSVKLLKEVPELEE
jgi:hypothetical protein